MKSSEQSIAHGALFADALSAALEHERGYRIPALRDVVARLGNTGTVRWVRQHDDTLARCSARWCPISAHVIIGSMAMVDACWPLAAGHFGAFGRLFQTTYDLPSPFEPKIAIELRSLEVEPRLDSLRERLTKIPPMNDGGGDRIRDAFDRFATLFRGIDKQWDAEDRFLARALSLFEPLQGLKPEISDEELLATSPLTRPGHAPGRDERSGGGPRHFGP